MKILPTFFKWDAEKLEKFIVNFINFLVRLCGIRFVRIKCVQIFHKEFTASQQTVSGILVTKFGANLFRKNGFFSVISFLKSVINFLKLKHLTWYNRTGICFSPIFCPNFIIWVITSSNVWNSKNTQIIIISFWHHLRIGYAFLCTLKNRWKILPVLKVAFYRFYLSAEIIPTRSYHIDLFQFKIKIYLKIFF